MPSRPRIITAVVAIFVLAPAGLLVLASTWPRPTLHRRRLATAAEGATTPMSRTPSGARSWPTARRVAVVLVPAIVLFSAVVSASAIVAAVGDAASAKTGRLEQAGQVLGYEVGEERRYVMGPPDALRTGEAAWWLIRLENVEGEGEDLRARFLLQHRRDAPRNIENVPLAGDILVAQVEAELTVNAHGAPLELAFIAQRRVVDVGDEAFQVTYRHQGDHYEKEVRFPGVDWSIDIEIPATLDVDPGRPAGWFVYAPATVACLEWVVGDEANVEACNELNTEPAFANAGLLSLMQPILWEEGGDTEVVWMSPTRPDLQPRTDGRAPVTFVPIIPNVPGVPRAGGLTSALSVPGLDFVRALLGGKTTGDEDRARDPARYFRPTSMRYTERASFDVGGRTMEGLLLEMGLYPGTAYIDDDGKVLRVDINPDAPEEERRWLRLLRASEY